ncbi:YkvA family protein [Longibaculum muris]|uniref:YkvA family protein n=1 Tax=Longibaculum muris TaxID=1796628 RepID=UPI0012BA252D|nr:YkvA family protein [Longibaculum muris]
MEKLMSEKTAKENLEKNYEKATELLKDEDQLERFLQRLEKKLKVIPYAGDKLADIPIMVSLVRNYVRKEYADVPIGTIIAIISALIYFVSPIDFVPDSIPVLGYFDDAAVVAACWKLVDTDVEEYIKWREKNNKVIDI